MVAEVAAWGKNCHAFSANKQQHTVFSLSRWSDCSARASEPLQLSERVEYPKTQDQLCTFMQIYGLYLRVYYL